MMNAASLPLDSWNNFYVIVGSSAGGLTGLTFVVIALVSDGHSVRLSGLRTFTIRFDDRSSEHEYAQLVAKIIF